MTVFEASLVPPRPPTSGEYARRQVRHGMRDVLEWLGEDVGPEPDRLVPQEFSIQISYPDSTPYP